MVQRRALNGRIDDEVRKYLRGESAFAKQIESALSEVDTLTRELVLHRAKGYDYRQSMSAFHVSDSQYYRRLQHFRQSLVLLIPSYFDDNH